MRTYMGNSKKVAQNGPAGQKFYPKILYNPRINFEIFKIFRFFNNFCNKFFIFKAIVISKFTCKIYLGYIISKCI